jgi:hypothetical protein
MPYVTDTVREKYDDHIDDINNTAPNAGELTYVIYRLAKAFSAGGTYARYALVIGCFICAILELYRRVVAPYEDTKIKENGDV